MCQACAIPARRRKEPSRFLRTSRLVTIPQVNAVMVGTRMHRLDLKDQSESVSTACRLPMPSMAFCQVTIASQARASTSAGNSWTIVSSPNSQP